MERVQSKFVIIKQIKEGKYCGRVSTEDAALWSSDPTLLSATPTFLPVRIFVTLVIKLYVGKINRNITNFLPTS